MHRYPVGRRAKSAIMQIEYGTPGISQPVQAVDAVAKSRDNLPQAEPFERDKPSWLQQQSRSDGSGLDETFH